MQGGSNTRMEEQGTTTTTTTVQNQRLICVDLDRDQVAPQSDSVSMAQFDQLSSEAPTKIPNLDAIKQVSFVSSSGKLLSTDKKPQSTIGMDDNGILIESLRDIIKQNDIEIGNLKQIVMGHMKLIDSMKEIDRDRVAKIQSIAEENKQKSQTIELLQQKLHDMIAKQNICQRCDNPASTIKRIDRTLTSDYLARVMGTNQTSEDYFMSNAVANMHDNSSVGSGGRRSALREFLFAPKKTDLFERRKTTTSLSNASGELEISSGVTVQRSVKESEIFKRFKATHENASTNDNSSHLRTNASHIVPVVFPPRKRGRPSLSEKRGRENQLRLLSMAPNIGSIDSASKSKKATNTDDHNIINLHHEDDDLHNNLSFFTTQDEYEIFSVMSSFDADSLKNTTNTILSIDNKSNNNNNNRDSSPETIDKIEVPSWRINHVNPTADIDLVENLDDETYNRRHLKHEIEERRRKRWDLQRLRDQQLKMKHGNSQVYSYHHHKRDKSCENKDLNTKFDVEPQFKSFFPDVSDVRFIEVNDEIPVVAFGRPVPRINNRWFTFPRPSTNESNDTQASKVLEAR